jgi:putative FmdB family regulatory protein
MPIYEYVCLDCKSDFELIRPMSQSDTSLKCESCGGKRVKRKLAMVVAMSGGHAVSGASGGSSCGSCSGGNCSGCSH